MKKLLLFVMPALLGIFGLLVPTTVFAAGPTAADCASNPDTEGCIKVFKENTAYGFLKDACVQTSILSEYSETSGGTPTLSCDNGSGSSVLEILGIVLDIMTVGIGIIGAIGITVVGIQYMTAGDNEEQVRKSKRRMFEIVIGFAAYVLIYALLKWLLPNFA